MLKFVCVFFFLLSLHPAGAWALREQREVSQQRLLLRGASPGVRDAVEWSAGFLGGCFANKPKSVPESFSGVCVQSLLFPLVLSPTARTLFVFMVFFSFANVPSHIPNRRPSNSAIQTF